MQIANIKLKIGKWMSLSENLHFAIFIFQSRSERDLACLFKMLN